jgi:hypothetical protein
MGGETELASLPAVTEATATRLAAAGIGAADITERRVSRRDLVAAGVGEGDADRIRREHGLAWGLHAGAGDLVRRAARVRGLTPGERAWVAASAADWEGAGKAAVGSVETDLTELPGVSRKTARRLATAGVTSLTSLAAADAVALADVIDADVRHIRTWRALARDRDDR